MPPTSKAGADQGVRGGRGGKSRSPIAELELDDDRKVVLAQLPRALRPAFAALWHLDLAFADVAATTSDPRLGAIRLAWWRERLEELDHGIVPAEPRLQAVAREFRQGQFLAPSFRIWRMLGCHSWNPILGMTKWQPG